MSLNRWGYVEENPVNLADPSGMFPDWCKSMNSRQQYEDCVRQSYNLSAPKDYPIMPLKQQKGSSGCWSGPVAYKAPGYLEGYSATISFAVGYGFGKELVYDFGTMEKGLFSYETASITLDASVSAMVYHGVVFGFNNVDSIKEGYRGPFWFVSGGVGADFPFPSPSIGTGVNFFHSLSGEIWGVSQYYSVGATLTTLTPGMSLAGGVGLTTSIWSRQPYLKSGSADYDKLSRDILIDPDSPIVLAAISVPSNAVKGIGIVQAAYWSWIYNEIHVNSK
jgi:hypothetical protein